MMTLGRLGIIYTVHKYGNASNDEIDENDDTAEDDEIVEEDYETIEDNETGADYKTVEDEELFVC